MDGKTVLILGGIAVAGYLFFTGKINLPDGIGNNQYAGSNYDRGMIDEETLSNLEKHIYSRMPARFKDPNFGSTSGGGAAGIRGLGLQHLSRVQLVTRGA